MFFSWFFLSTVILIIALLFFQVFYYKSSYENEKKTTIILKANLKEAEINIKKYQMQFQRSMGNIDITQAEMNKLKNNLKTFKSKNSQFRIESDRLKHKIKELETKIEALL